jgi:hypothetical protein
MLIIRGIEKRRIVDDEADREEFVVRMIRIAEDTETVLYAWSLMKLKLFCGSSFQTGNEEKR